MKLFNRHIFTIEELQSRMIGEYRRGMEAGRAEEIERQEVQKIKKNRQASVIIEKVLLTEEYDYRTWADMNGRGVQFFPATYDVRFRIGHDGKSVTVKMTFNDQDFSMADIRAEIQEMVCGKTGCQ